MRLPRITIFILIFSFLLQPLAPAMVQAAPKNFDSLPPFPEDTKATVIDWATVDWEEPVTLPADTNEYNQKIAELEKTGQRPPEALAKDGRFAEIGKLKPRARLMSDADVLAHYGAPQAVQDLDDADPGSFEVVKVGNWYYYGKDANNVWVYDNNTNEIKKIEGANPGSFDFEAHTNQDTIQSVTPTPVDTTGFKNLGADFFTDSSNIWYFGPENGERLKLESVDAASFKLLSSTYPFVFKDKRLVWIFTRDDLFEISGADLSTFKKAFAGVGVVYKDSLFVYVLSYNKNNNPNGETVRFATVPGADPATIEIAGSNPNQASGATPLLKDKDSQYEFDKQTLEYKRVE